MRVLVLNAGSSSLKATVLDVGRREPVASTSADWGSDATRAAGRADAVGSALASLAEGGAEAATLDAVGHRIVHGGTHFREPLVVDDRTVAALEGLGQLAPLHNAVAVEALAAARRLLPTLPHVAAFDTAFHATLQPEAFVYPLPWEWYAERGIRRYGFHGLSVEWSVHRAAELLGRTPAEIGMVVAHLGSGCSVTAVDGGRSVATSMGLTPLEGLMMGTRGGSVDPGIILRLLDEEAPGALDVPALEEALNHRSGLLGVSGVSGDVRQVTAAAGAGDDRAALALALFVRRAAEGICAAASSLRRLDVIVFTGGIGEHAAEIRARIVERLGVLGVERVARLVPDDSDAILSRPGAPVHVLRIEAREDLIIAGAVAGQMDQRPVQPPST